MNQFTSQIVIKRVAIGVQAEMTNRAPADYWSPLEGEDPLPTNDQLVRMLRRACQALGMEPDYITVAVLDGVSGTQLSSTNRFNHQTGEELYTLMMEVIAKFKQK